MTTLDDIEKEYIKVHFTKRGSMGSAFCEGDLILIVDKTTKIILDFYCIIEKCKIDLYTTASWFEKPKHKRQLQLRQELLKKLNLGDKHDKRPKKGSGEKRNNLHEFKKNDWQIEKLNNFLNDKTKCTTLKSLVWLIAGNNPSGEESNPKNAPLVACYHNEWVPFSLLFDGLYFGNKYRELAGGTEKKAKYFKKSKTILMNSLTMIIE